MRSYKLIGRLAVPCSTREWADPFASDDRIVGKTAVGCLEVSTVFLGLDHSYGGGPPLLFETMIFGDDIDAYQTRCTTWEEAEAMHAKAVEVATALVRAADEAIAKSKAKFTERSDPMTDDERADFDLLKMATEENGVFALQIATAFSEPSKQFALERMQRRGWVTLIDVSPITIHPDRLFRIFKASDEAMTWFRKQQ